MQHKVGKVRTDWREFTQGGKRFRIRAEYGFESMNGPGRDHFSITGETERFGGGRWLDDSGGCIHDEIAKHFPDLAELIPWHLVDESGPMHYLANGMFWWDRIGRAKERSYDPDATEAFRSTIVWCDADAATYPGDPIRDACAVRVATKENADPFGVYDGEREAARMEPRVAERRAAVKVWLMVRRAQTMAAFWRTMAAHGLATLDEPAPVA